MELDRDRLADALAKLHHLHDPTPYEAADVVLAELERGGRRPTRIYRTPGDVPRKLPNGTISDPGHYDVDPPAEPESPPLDGPKVPDRISKQPHTTDTPAEST